MFGGCGLFVVVRGGSLQAAVWLFEGTGGDGGVVKVDGVEEGLAEHATDGVGRLVVEGADVLEEVEAGVEVFRPGEQSPL